LGTLLENRLYSIQYGFVALLDLQGTDKLNVVVTLVDVKEAAVVDMT
jgi:hypothetical protein